MKSIFASARAFRAVQVKATTMAQVSKPLLASAATNTLQILSDGPTTRNQKRLIDQAIDQLDAEKDKGDE